MKIHSKRTGILLIVLCLICAFSLLLAACGEKGLPNDPPDGEYTFGNSNSDRAQTDETVTMDGAFDEAFWAEQRWYNYTVEVYAGYEITVRATSYFGDKGIYFAVGVEDGKVNFNENKRATYNSGVELMFAEGSVTQSTANRNLYRYLFNAGGTSTLARYYTLTNNYVDYSVEMQSMPWSALELQGGTIESGDCTGYNTEVFIPYTFFSTDGTKVEELHVYFSVIASNTSTEDLDRYYITLNDKQISSGWLSPETWYAFDENGLVGNNINVTVGEHGTAVPQYDYILQNMQVPIVIRAEQGYRVSALTVNGVDCLDKIEFGTDGSGVYTISYSQAGDVAVEVQFEKLPDETYTITGTISLDSASFSGDVPSAQALYEDISQVNMSSSGLYYDVDFSIADDTITYSATVYAGTYDFSVLSARGYTLYKGRVSVADNVTYDVAVTEDGWLNSVFIDDIEDKSSTVGTSQFDVKIWESSQEQKVSHYAFTYFEKISLDMSSKTQMTTDLRFDFENGNYIRVTFSKWDGTWSINFRTATATLNGNALAGTSVMQSYETNHEGYMMIEVSGTTMRAWLIDLQGNTILANTQTFNWLNTSYLKAVYAKKGAEDAGGSLVLTISDIVLGFGKTSDEMLSYVFDETSINVTNNAEDIIGNVSGLEGSYSYGENVTFSVTVPAEYNYCVLTVTHNGNVILADARENGDGSVVYTYAFDVVSVNNIVIDAVTSAKLSVSAKLAQGTSAIDKLYAVDAQGTEYELVLSGSVYEKTLAPGSYEIKAVSAGGYACVLGSVTLEEDATANYELTADRWLHDGFLDNIADLTGITESSPNFNNLIWKASETDYADTSSFIYIEKLGLDMSTKTQMTTDLRFDFENGNYIRVTFSKWDGTWSVNFRTAAGTLNGNALAGTEVISSYETNHEVYMVIEISGTTMRAWLVDLTGNVRAANTQTFGWLEDTVLTAIYAKKGTEDSTQELTLNLTDIALGFGKSFDELMAHQFNAQTVSVTNNAQDYITVTVSPDASYSYGETVTLVLNVSAGQVPVVTLNGSLLTAEGEDNVYTYTFASMIVNSVVIDIERPMETSVTVNVASGLAQVASVTLIDEYGQSVSFVSDDGTEFTGEVAKGVYTVKIMTAEGFTYMRSSVSIDENTSAVVIELNESNWVSGAFIDDDEKKSTTTGGSAFDTTVWTAMENTSLGSDYIFFERFDLDFTSKNALSTDLMFTFADDSFIRLQIYKYEEGGATGFRVNIMNNSSTWLQSPNFQNSRPEILTTLESEGGYYLAVTFEGTAFNVYFISKTGETYNVRSDTVSWLANTSLVSVTAKKGSEDKGGSLELAITEVSVGIAQSTDDMLKHKFDAQTISLTNDAEQYVTITVQPESSYVYGDTVTMTLQLNESGKALSVTHNGKALTPAQDGTLYTYTFTASILNDVVISVSDISSLCVTLSAAESMSAVSRVVASDAQTGAETVLHFSDGVYSSSLANGTYIIKAVSENGYVSVLDSAAEVSGETSKTYTLTDENWLNAGFVVLGDQSTTAGGSSFNVTMWQRAESAWLTEGDVTYFEKLSLDIGNLGNAASSMTTDLRFDFDDGNNVRVTIYKDGLGGYFVNFRLNNAGSTPAESGSDLSGEAVMQSFVETGETYLAVTISGNTLSVYFIDGEGNYILANSVTYDWLGGTVLKAVLAKKGSEDTSGATLSMTEAALGVGVSFEDTLAAKFPAQA